ARGEVARRRARGPGRHTNSARRQRVVCRSSGGGGGHCQRDERRGLARGARIRRRRKPRARKLLIDVANPLDVGKGMPPSLLVCNVDSLGEQIQRAHPEAKVVKALNTVNADVMVDPSGVPGDHVIFVCGNAEAAKAAAVELSARSAGRRTASSTSATSPQRAVRRCTSSSGSVC